MIIET